MSEPNTRPKPCGSCAAGKHRAYCATYPTPCEELISIWDDGYAAAVLDLQAKWDRLDARAARLLEVIRAVGEWDRRTTGSCELQNLLTKYEAEEKNDQ